MSHISSANRGMGGMQDVRMGAQEGCTSCCGEREVQGTRTISASDRCKRVQSSTDDISHDFVCFALQSTRAMVAGSGGGSG